MILKLHKPTLDGIYYATDDTRECSNECAFLLTPLNIKYIDRCPKNTKFIQSNELKSYFDFSSIKIIGITGTNGKTTTAGAIYSILLDLGYKVAMQGTRGFFVNGIKTVAKTLTTPMQLANFSNIDYAIKQGCEFFITEVSSHAIAQKRIEGLYFDLKIFTNLTQDHLDFHKTFEEYKNTKLSFLSNGNILFNADDPAALVLNGYSYGIEKNADFRVSAYSTNNGLWFCLDNEDKTYEMHSGLVGKFNIYNLAAAVATVNIMTTKTLDEIADVLDNFGGVEGRMQVVSEKPLVIVDFAHTPDGIARALDAISSTNLTVVFGAGGDRDHSKRPLMGKEVASRAKVAIVTSDNPRSEDPNEIINEIASGMYGFSGRLIIEPDRKKAIEIALNDFGTSIIAILGKGDEIYQEIGEQKLPFDDREVVKELLRDN